MFFCGSGDQKVSLSAEAERRKSSFIFTFLCSFETHPCFNFSCKVLWNFSCKILLLIIIEFFLQNFLAKFCYWQNFIILLNFSCKILLLIGSCTNPTHWLRSCSGANLKYWLRSNMQTLEILLRDHLWYNTLQWSLLATMPLLISAFYTYSLPLS